MPIYNASYNSFELPKTLTITWEEKADMSSGWVYSDDAEGLTAGDSAFDDFFGYSAVRLNTSGVETATVSQSGGVLDITQLGTLTSGDNVMIKFPVRGIKITKDGSTVTLSITRDLDKTGYQYYAHSTGTFDSPTLKEAFYLGVYKSSLQGGVLKSYSGATPSGYSESSSISLSNQNGTGYDIEGFYQRMYINALYMMKYGNPNSKSAVGAGGSGPQTTGATDSITNATGVTGTRVKLFGLEDRWGNVWERLGGAYQDSSYVLYTQLSGWTGYISGGTSTGNSIYTGYSCLSGIQGNNTDKMLFTPSSSVNNSSYNTYYCDYVYTQLSNRLAMAGGQSSSIGALSLDFSSNTSSSSSSLCSRLMYL